MINSITSINILYINIIINNILLSYTFLQDDNLIYSCSIDEHLFPM